MSSGFWTHAEERSDGGPEMRIAAHRFYFLDFWLTEDAAVECSAAVRENHNNLNYNENYRNCEPTGGHDR
jgi:hypothetical protein